METWQVVVIALTGNTLGVGAIGWLFKTLILSAQEREATRFKVQLQSQSDLSATEFKAKLELAATEHQVRFSRLHERRAEVIAETYRLLVEAMWAAEDFLSLAEWVGEPSKAEKYVTARNSLAEYFRQHDRNRIYLPPLVNSQMDSLMGGIRGDVIHFGVYAQMPNETLQDHTIREKHDIWHKTYKRMRDEVPVARALLEDEFRKLLGDSIPNHGEKPTNPGAETR